MRRLISKQFTIEQQRYLFTIDTDGLKLFLKCYQGSSEKSLSVKLNKISPVRIRILDIVASNYSSSLHKNLLENTEKITLEVRREYAIPYPDSENFISFKDALKANGMIQIDSKDIWGGLKDYLEYHQIKFVLFEENEHIIFIGSADQLKVYLRSIDDEIKRLSDNTNRLSDLKNDLYNQLDSFDE